ncbi:class I adenylate cyclase, partial [Pseudomonas fluorescens]|uniref:class I adenylate cyclase n=1 Tax=Pseudomonas fluorescens TaxID=294 RepID=UPI001781AAE3
EQSDMDLWVCHDAHLSDTERDELRRKCLRLEAWAASLGAEVHLYLVESRGLVPGQREGELSSDDCGTTRHCLLLDEFYRTAIWLAGRTPLWWLVPACQERDYHTYTQNLLSKRLVRAEDNLDLGHLAHMQPGEFVGAGLWQLFKGVHSPHKSVLKLLLTEVYASEHPRVH